MFQVQFATTIRFVLQNLVRDSNEASQSRFQVKFRNIDGQIEKKTHNLSAQGHGILNI